MILYIQSPTAINSTKNNDLRVFAPTQQQTNKKKKKIEILSGPCMTIFFFFSDQALDPGTGIPVKSI